MINDKFCNYTQHLEHMQGDGNDAADDKDETVLEELPDKVDLILKVGIKFSALLLKTQRQVVQMLTSLTVEDYDRPTNRQANRSDILIRVFLSLFFLNCIFMSVNPFSAKEADFCVAQISTV